MEGKHLKEDSPSEPPQSEVCARKTNLSLAHSDCCFLCHLVSLHRRSPCLGGTIKGEGRGEGCRGAGEGCRFVKHSLCVRSCLLNQSVPSCCVELTWPEFQHHKGSCFIFNAVNLTTKL